MSEEVNPEYLQPGTKIGFYEVVTLVGRGGFGALYKVVRDGEVFALKLATKKLSDLSDEDREHHEERADREIVALKSLRHPNIVRVHAFERWPDFRKGYPFIVMDFVEGHRLYDWRAKQTPSLRRIAEVFRKIALALDEMHRLDLFHRDLKSENVLVRSDGEPIIIDFGIARPRSTYTVTSAGGMLGTYTHFPPEYCKWHGSAEWKRGELFRYTPPTELHAVGYMLYQCVAGRPPFTTDPADAIDLMEEIVNVVPAAPSTVNAKVPAAMDGIVMKLLEKEPGNRYQSGAELAQALEAVVLAADSALDIPLDVPARPSGRRSAETKNGRLNAVVPPATDVPLSATHIRVPAPPVAGIPVPSTAGAAPVVEAQRSDARPGHEAPPAPAVPMPANFAPPTGGGPSFVDPGAAAAAAQPTPAAPGIPSTLQREAAKIQDAQRAATRSKLALPLAVVGGVVAVFALVFVSSLSANPPAETSAKPTSLLSEAERAEAQRVATKTELGAEVPLASEKSHPPALDTRVPVLESNATGAPPQTSKGAPPRPWSDGPSWLRRGERLDSPAPAAAGDAPKKYGVPLGAKIRVRLLTNLDSRTVANGPVEAVLVRSFVLRGEVVFPSRTMVYGRAVSGNGRFNLELTRLRLPDNTEVAFEGLAMDPEESKPGLPASGRIALVSPKGDSLGTKVAKGAANVALGQVGGDTASDLVRTAGQTVVSHADSSTGGMGEALLLDRGVDFDVFVKQAF